MQRENFDVRLRQFAFESLRRSPCDAIIAPERIAVGEDEDGRHGGSVSRQVRTSNEYTFVSARYCRADGQPRRLSPHVSILRVGCYALATSSSTSPWGLNNCIRSGIWPHACVEQLKQGS